MATAHASQPSAAQRVWETNDIRLEITRHLDPGWHVRMASLSRDLFHAAVKQVWWKVSEDQLRMIESMGDSKNDSIRRQVYSSAIRCVVLDRQPLPDTERPALIFQKHPLVLSVRGVVDVDGYGWPIRWSRDLVTPTLHVELRVCHMRYHITNSHGCWYESQPDVPEVICDALNTPPAGWVVKSFDRMSVGSWPPIPVPVEPEFEEVTWPHTGRFSAGGWTADLEHQRGFFARFAGVGIKEIVVGHDPGENYYEPWDLREALPSLSYEDLCALFRTVRGHTDRLTVIGHQVDCDLQSFLAVLPHSVQDFERVTLELAFLPTGLSSTFVDAGIDAAEGLQSPRHIGKLRILSLAIICDEDWSPRLEGIDTAIEDVNEGERRGCDSGTGNGDRRAPLPSFLPAAERLLDVCGESVKLKIAVKSPTEESPLRQRPGLEVQVRAAIEDAMRAVREERRARSVGAKKAA